MFRIQNLQENLMVQIDFDCKLTYFDFGYLLLAKLSGINQTQSIVQSSKKTTITGKATLSL